MKMNLRKPTNYTKKGKKLIMSALSTNQQIVKDALKNHLYQTVDIVGLAEETGLEYGQVRDALLGMSSKGVISYLSKGKNSSPKVEVLQ